MADIRTTQEVNVDGVTVLVADADTDSERFEAAVVAAEKSSLNKAFSSFFGDDSDKTTVTDAPICTDEAKYIAVGKAVEAYLEQLAEEANDG